MAGPTFFSTRWLIIAVAVNAVLGQLLLKRAVSELGGRDAIAFVPKFILDALSNPWLYASVFVQGVGYLLWMMLISREKLGVATASVGAAFYIFLPISAWAIYGENISYLQWFGICLVTLGVICVGLGVD